MASRKKKRTPAQIRATKKLVALNRKRRAKKKVVKRKVAKRRVNKRKVAKKRAVKRGVRRKTNPSKGYFYILAKNIKTGKEGYYTGRTFDTSKTKALLSKTKSVMTKIAKNISINRKQWNLYVGSK